MMLLRFVGILFLFAVISCEMFSTEKTVQQATVLHQLYGLHNAIYAYVENNASHTTLTPVVDEEHESEIGKPVDTSTEKHVSLPADSENTSISIVAVVDSSLLVPTAEDSEIDPAAKESAMKRERLVRTALSNSLCNNKYFEIIQPSPIRETIREDIIATNGSSLAKEDAASVGTEIGVDHLIWALIENEGDNVIIWAQRVDNGVVVFNETLVGWDIFEASNTTDAQ